MVEKINFDFLNGYILEFEVFENINDGIIDKSLLVKVNIQGVDECFIEKDRYIIIVPGLGFRFNSKKDTELFVSKLVFFKINQLKKIVFFELIDKDELLNIFITKRSELTKNIEFTKPGATDVYLFNGGKVLSADTYGRSGECYQNLEDYITILRNVF
jgi:hypothetical protein